MKKYKKYYLTSESVTEGHPDKVCDFISDSILDACLEQDKNSRVAVETLISKDKVIVAGQITSDAIIDIEKIVREKLKEVDYTDSKTNMDYKTCEVEVNITKLSKDIALGVDYGGAGDQGIMFGYATDESEDYMPYPISIANKLSRKLAEVRKNGEIPYLKSDGKVQVTIEYVNDEPFRVDTILISAQHFENVNIETLQKDIFKKVIIPVVPADMIDIETKFYINPTGRFVLGGAVADTGLTGRKIMVDTYGGLAHHGGGAFSGKDGTKVDRSASYMLRHIAKNVVANGLARKCEIQLSYGIGVIEPISIYIDCFNTNKVPEWMIIKLIKARFDLSPQGIIEYLKLREPIFSKTTNYGHFGRDGFAWEEFVQM
ncbi:s-adenosylmethionine synthase [Clostridium sp. CAG:356]|jgi:methionine adenosyltransferase|nr:MAG: methionine adenosyltransferase [Clostridium sp. 28_12]CDD36562.1 s-adenosylmethionine synthase [Clostridium sp. CAG:356]